MKTFIKPLLVAFSLSVLSLSATQAETNPIRRAAKAATYKTGIYPTIGGKLQISLDKEAVGAIDVQLKDENGKVLFFQHMGKREKQLRLRLNLNELPEGNYHVEISNGVNVTTQTITVGARQATEPSRVLTVE